jgi:hypothetical protein
MKAILYHEYGSPDPADDLGFRGTALAAPLFLPAVLTSAAVLARARSWLGAIGAAIVVLVGVAFFLGGIFNLPNDLDAARAAGSPTGLTIAFGVVPAIFGLAFAALAGAELVARLRRRTSVGDATHANTHGGAR